MASETFDILLPADAGPFFPAIYESSTAPFDPYSRPRFGLSFPADLLPEGHDYTGVRIGPKGKVRASSNLRPEVEGVTYDELLQQEARNLPRDALFRDVDLIITVDIYDYELRDPRTGEVHNGRGLGIRKIRRA